MSLRGQASRTGEVVPNPREGGYAMAALLVAIAVMAIMMAVAMPVWRHDAQREKEAELVWRGNQYVRAIRLFQAKTRTFPTSVDMLVQGRFLRQKYLDPITNQEFAYIGAGSAGQPGGGPAQANPGAQTAGRGAPTSLSFSTANARGGVPTSSSIAQPSNNQSGSFAPATASSVPGGLIGVQSKSTDESIMVYNGRTHYNEWLFLYVAQNPGVPGRGGPIGPQNGRGGRNGPGGQNGPGGRGIRGGPGGNNPFPFPFPSPGGRGRGRGGGL